MDETDSSGSDLEHLLGEYRKKLKESQQNSNINIGVNVPNKSGPTSISVSVESEASTRKEEEEECTTKKKSKSKRPLKPRMPKRAKFTENDENQANVDDVQKTKRNYAKLTSKELNSIASRVRIFHEQGMVVSDEEDVIPCENKYKGKQKNKNRLNQPGAQVPGITFGQGKVGVSSTNFGACRCACCNVIKSKCASKGASETANSSSYVDITKGMPKDRLKKLREREEHLLQVQQRQLPQHPELLDSKKCNTEVSLPPIEFSSEEWVQRYMESMSVDRVDYETPVKLNIVEGISHTRPSDVHLKNEETLADSLDAKTIVERIDFEKEKERHSRLNQHILDDWLKPKDDETSSSAFQIQELIATSTPKPSTSNFYKHHLNLFQENASGTLLHEEAPESNDTGVRNNLEPNPVVPPHVPSADAINTIDLIDSTIGVSTMSDFNSDYSHLDRSNITIRTPQSKAINGFSHSSIPSSSKPKPAMSQDVAFGIIDFVNSLVAPQRKSIEQEAQERCERIIENAQKTRSLLNNALDDVLITNNDIEDRYDSLMDCSVVIVEDECVPPIRSEDEVQVIESDDEASLYINEFVDAAAASSTWRTTRNRRKQPVRGKQKKSKRGALSSVKTPVPPPNPVTSEATNSVETENKPSIRSLRDCPICLESLISKEISSTTCGHVFCTPCITAAVRAQRLCPNCRTSLTLKKIHPLYL